MIVFPVLEYNNVPMLWHTLEKEYIEYRLLCRASIFLLHAPAACLWDCLHSQIRPAHYAVGDKLHLRVSRRKLRRNYSPSAIVTLYVYPSFY